MAGLMFKGAWTYFRRLQ